VGGQIWQKEWFHPCHALPTIGVQDDIVEDMHDAFMDAATISKKEKDVRKKSKQFWSTKNSMKNHLKR
jgi:hypothetical protein